MPLEDQVQDSFRKGTELIGNLTFRQLIDSLESLEVRVSDMEEILGSYSENMSEEMT